MGRKRDPDDPAQRGPVAYGTSHHLSDQLEAAGRACDSRWHVWTHKALERAEAGLASCGTAGLTGDPARLVRRAQAGPDSSAAAAG